MLLNVVAFTDGTGKRDGYIIEWWIGDHSPKHVHVYKNRRQVAKIVVPDMRVLSGKVNRKLRKVIEELIAEGKI